MPQLHLYLPDELVDQVKERARARGLSVSAYLAEIVKSQMVDDWPEDFFDTVVGGWAGEPLRRPEQPPLERREEVDVPSGHERVHPDPQ
jgi:hypothetical protein